MLGTDDEVSALGVNVPRPILKRTRRPWIRRVLDPVRAVGNGINPGSIRSWSSCSR
jgi:hypothetical protein